METKILLDTEMTKYVASFTKGGTIAKYRRKLEWLKFTEEAFEMENGNCEKFKNKVNKWLRKHKVPITILEFNPTDPQIFGTQWTIEVNEK